MHTRRRFRIILALTLLAAGVALGVRAWPRPRAITALRQDVYVWQRAWTPAVCESVVRHGDHFSQVVALAAQVGWRDGKPHVARVAIDWPALKQCGASIGLAIRVNEYPGPLAETGDAANLLADLARDLTSQVVSNGLTPTELQIDFDAAESKLDGYQLWVQAIKRRNPSLPVVITAVPSWLDASGFEDLAKAAGEYVLQVHSFERPKWGDRISLCDIDAARRAVERAGRLGIPFRVALPTYGYAVAFDESRRFLGLSAEGRSPAWPSGALVRDVRADATDMASLVAGWSADRPQALRGIIWYRLPTADDAMNWRWPTLEAAMTGQVPRSELRAQAHRDPDGVATLEVINTGQADEPLNFAVIPQSAGAVISADAYEGFERREVSGQTRFVGTAAAGRLGAGDRRVVGWVRVEGDKEVVVNVSR